MIFNANITAQVFTRYPDPGPVRLNPTVGPLTVTGTEENPAGTGAWIHHVDLAVASPESPRQNIFVQSGAARLIRTNSTSQSVLRLLH